MSRIKGSSRTGEIIPTVKLVNMSTYPLGTVVSLWTGSRYNETFEAKDLEDLYYDRAHDEYIIDKLCEFYPEYAGENKDYKNIIENIAKLVVKGGFPVLDAINFTFEIENANIAWREQIVRGRLPQNFWMQSSRISDLEYMDVNRVSSIEELGGEEAVKIYDETVQNIRDAYRKLVELGVPQEDIRLMPQGMIHRVYWMVPYRTLVYILSKRISWTAQITLWSPIVEGIFTELYKYCPFFANILGVPYDVVVGTDKIEYHTDDSDNEDRYYGKDYQPCDPLWLAYRGLTPPAHTDKKMYDMMKRSYIKIWNDDICRILGWDKNNPDIKGKYDV